MNIIGFVSFVFLSCIILCESQSDVKDLEKNILNSILDKTKYDSRISPVNQESGPVVVNTNLFVRQIQYICTKKQEWKVQITFRHQWNDPRLKFENLDGKGAIKYVSTIETDNIWTPDTFLSNSMSTQSHKDIKPNLLIRIYPKGDVLFSIRLDAVLSCPMDLKHYPFDSQTCGITFASYGYTKEHVVYKWKEGDPVQVTKNIHLPDFTLKSFNTSYCTQSSKTNTGEYSCLKTEFQFKRVSSKYICSWLIPTALLTFASFASFCLKPGKSCRIKFLAAILVLLYLHTIYINNKSSSGASYSTAKDCWLSTCLFFVLFTFVEYGVVAIINKITKQSNNEKKQNRKIDPESDAVALKPLVDNGKDNSESNNKYPVNESSSHFNIVQKWKNSTTASRIDQLSIISFPLLFVIYIITFSSYQTLQ